jgi:hypothetical protein
VSSRDARAGTARSRTRDDRGRSGAVRASARRDRPTAGSRGTPGRPPQASLDPAPRGDGLVIGTVPLLARVAGLLLVLAGVAGIAAAFPTYLVVGGRALTLAGSAAATAAVLLVPVAHLAVGAVLAAGRVPKLGLAYATVAAALGVGRLLIEIYLGQSSTDRPGVEVLAGQLVLTSSVDVGGGWTLAVTSLALLVLAGAVAVAAWGRTVMDDAGALDPARSALAGTAVLLGVATVLCLTLPPADVPDDLVTDPVTGLQTVVPREGPQGLLERPLLALLGGLLLAGAVLLCSALAPSLRPRLAAVGGFLAIAVAVLAAGIGGWADARGSDDLAWTVPGVGLVLTGLGYGLLTVLAWRLHRDPAPRE